MQIAKAYWSATITHALGPTSADSLIEQPRNARRALEQLVSGS